MNKTSKLTHIAYRCPDCGTLIYGLVGEMTVASNAIRLKCDCGKSFLDIAPTQDKKIRISIPCILCKENHNFVVSPAIFFERDIFLLNCPYANMDIGFVGDKEKIDEAAKNNEAALRKLIADMGLEAIEELQPIDLDEEDILPDASVYDLIRFVVKDLEAEGGIDCPCHKGTYELRYAPGGIQAYCEDCGATYTFYCESPSAAEEYLNVTEITLK